MYQIVFSDIDGTLIQSDFQVGLRTKTAIRRVVDQGKIFVPVSARMPRAIQPIVDSLGISCPIISYNGALIQDETGEVLFSQGMDIGQVRAICRFIEEQHEAIAWNVYSYDRWYAQIRPSEWVDREEAIVQVDAERVELAALEQLELAHKVLLMGSPLLIPALEVSLKEEYPELSIAQSAPYFIEIMAAGIEKGRAVANFAACKGVDLANTMAFGDNYNDIEMLKTVGLGVVMGNAPDDIRSQFDCVTADHNHDGIALILEGVDEV
ncbi:Cof-type HAD-IIB family hydrolase [Streptococcus oriscaviae]|uniref:HAD family phosphatase n=1 Tax=Streptococcus oriscaviae TaxID=2781599 RepID=A0ABX7YIE8_9STRE|nr:Cof-type HAD-IIB family hydrolase [Streptococcus oriscaviae]QUE53460.1 HAD family phosphatase [Streptococcus oriscaviae]